MISITIFTILFLPLLCCRITIGTLSTLSSGMDIKRRRQIITQQENSPFKSTSYSHTPGRSSVGTYIIKQRTIIACVSYGKSIFCAMDDGGSNNTSPRWSPLEPLGVWRRKVAKVGIASYYFLQRITKNISETFGIYNFYFQKQKQKQKKVFCKLESQK